MSHNIYTFNIVLEVIARANRQGKNNKGIEIEKEKVELSLLIEDIILRLEKPKVSTKTLLEINKNSKVAGYKSKHKNQLCLYTLTTNYQKEIKNTMPFKITIIRMKYLGINLIKQVKDLYTENEKTLLKKLKKKNKWKYILCSGILISNIIKMSILPKTIYSFNTVLRISIQWK